MPLSNVAAFIPPKVARDQRPLVLLFIVILILIFQLRDDNPSLSVVNPSEDNNPLISNSTLVWLKGDVAQPGLYLLPKSSSVVGLYERVGVEPPMLVSGERAGFEPLSTLFLESHNRPRFSAMHPALTPFFFRPLPVNQADKELLMTIRGIGPGLAARIIELREVRGGFFKLEELLDVSGIGPVIYERIRHRMVVE